MQTVCFQMFLHIQKKKGCQKLTVVNTQTNRDFCLLGQNLFLEMMMRHYAKHKITQSYSYQNAFACIILDRSDVMHAHTQVNTSEVNILSRQLKRNNTGFLPLRFFFSCVISFISVSLSLHLTCCVCQPTIMKHLHCNRPS